MKMDYLGSTSPILDSKVQKVPVSLGVHDSVPASTSKWLHPIAAPIVMGVVRMFSNIFI